MLSKYKMLTLLNLGRVLPELSAFFQSSFLLSSAADAPHFDPSS